MVKKRKMTSKKAVQELTDLKRDIFPYLHRDYNEALTIAIESLEREGKQVRAERVGERFKEMANRWHDETDHLSSSSRITNNGLYLEIISMGETAIPFILRDLQERGGDWYPALRILSDADPVPTEVRGEVPKMKEAWISWGRDKGYIK